MSNDLPRSINNVLVGLVFGLPFPVGIYLGIAWGLGLLSHPEVGWGYLAGGIGLMFVVMAIVSVMGESIIEDFVKLAMFTVLAVVAGPMMGLPGIAVALGAPCGAATPILFRLVNGIFERGHPNRRYGDQERRGGNPKRRKTRR